MATTHSRLGTAPGSSSERAKIDASVVFALLKQTYTEWANDKAARHAAALAYYTIFSIAPLLIIIIQIVALVLGGGHAAGHHQVARDAIFSNMQGTLGTSGADALITIVDATLKQQKQGLLAGMLSWIVLLFAAAGLVGALQDALNTVWNAKPKFSGLVGMVRARLASFSIIGGVAFVLLASLVVNTALTAFSHLLEGVFPAFPFLMNVVDFAVSLGIVSALFAVVFKYLPDTNIEWRDVWAGALATGVLFVIGQFLLGWYLGRAAGSSTYGAAGSLVVLLLWVYYSAQIMLFGAEFTKVYAHAHGSRLGQPPPEAASATASSP